MAWDEELRQPEQSMSPTFSGLQKRRKTIDCGACKYRNYSISTMHTAGNTMWILCEYIVPIG